MKTPAFVPTTLRIAAFAVGTTILCFAGTLPATVIMNYGDDGDDANRTNVVGSGHVVSETREVSGFHGLAQEIGGDLTIVQGDQEGLVVEGEDNILPLVQTSVDKAGILHLGIKKQAGRLTYEKELVFKLRVKRLDSLDLATSGHVQAASLKADKLDIRVKGSCETNVGQLDTPQLTATILGSGSIKLAGNVRTQQVKVNGSGDYEGRGLQTQDTTVVVNGSGKAQVWADATLDAVVNGSGDVSYRGNATLTKRINGSGHLHLLADK